MLVWGRKRKVDEPRALFSYCLVAKDKELNLAVESIVVNSLSG
jgi:hypothetical protein